MAEILRVTVDTRQLKRALKTLGEQAPRAIMRALNRTARTARTQAVRAVGKAIRVPQKQVRPMLPVIPATPTFLEAKLVAQGRSISLMRLGARQTKLGVMYRGPAGPVLLRSAFIVSLPRGGRGVFKREPLPSVRKSRGAWGFNLPIQRQLGPSVPQLVLEQGIFQGLQRTTPELLAKNLAHEVQNLLDRNEARRG